MRLKKKLFPLFVAVGCALFLPAALTSGQSFDTTQVAILEEVVVTATRSQKNLNEIGRSITVISHEDINKTGLATVSELLNFVEGFYIVGAQQNPGSLNNISTRGSANSHTVIMIDGIRISDPSSTDNSLDLSELSVADIWKIEIVRGSHSTLFGSSAIGGVINIITSGKNETPGIHADASLRGGLFGKGGHIASENISLNYTHPGGFYISTALFNINSGGINSTVDTITNPSTYKNPDMNDGFRKTDIVAKTGYKSDNLELNIGYRRIDQQNDIDDGAFNDDENYTTAVDRNLLTYNAKYIVGNRLSFMFNGGISDMQRVVVDDSSLVDAAGNTDKSFFSATYSGSIANHELQANLSFKGIDIVIGTGTFKETMSAQTYYYSNSYGEYISESDLDTLNIYSVSNTGFIHTDLNGALISDALIPFSLGLGGRILNHSTFGTEYTLEINPSLKLSNNALIYASYSTGFNSPSLYQLYSPEQDYSSGITRGNRSLKPEESVSWEIGFKQKINNSLWWSISYFKTTVANSIDYVYLWNKDTEIGSLTYLDYFGDTYINLGKQTNRGFEFSIHSKVSEKLSVSGNLSLVNGKLDYDPQDIDNVHTQGNHIQLYSNGAFISRETERVGLVRRPNTANISISYYPLEKLSMTLNIKYVGTRNDVFYDSTLGPYGALGTTGMEDYSLVGFLARYTCSERCNIMLHIENITNTRYYEIRGYSTRGRGIYAGINYSF